MWNYSLSERIVQAGGPEAIAQLRQDPLLLRGVLFQQVPGQQGFLRSFPVPDIHRTGISQLLTHENLPGLYPFEQRAVTNPELASLIR